MSQPTQPDDEGTFHPQERQPAPEGSATNSQLHFEDYRQILKRESSRDKSWLFGVLGLVFFLIAGAVAVYAILSN
ncbi:MAG: hypothetical protein AB7K24_27715 [Gemmataceae bacterium]